MSLDQIEEKVIFVLNALLKQQINKGADFTREEFSNWDSLKHIEIMFALEEEFEIEFCEDELVKLDSLSKIVDSVQRKYEA